LENISDYVSINIASFLGEKFKLARGMSLTGNASPKINDAKASLMLT